MVQSLVTRLENVVISFLSCFVLIYLIVFYNWLFHTEVADLRILIHSVFVDLFCLSNWFLYLLVADRLFGWLFSYFVVVVVVVVVGWLVGLVGWLVLVHSGTGWLLRRLAAPRSFPLLDFTEHKSSTDHNGWQRTSQIWNVTHSLSLFRGTEPWPEHLHIRYCTIS